MSINKTNGIEAEMNRFSNSKVLLMTFIFSLLFYISETDAWENRLTHPAITQKAVERSVLSGDYLRTQIGIGYDLNTPLELANQEQSDIDIRVSREPEFKWDKTYISILDWLKEGSSLEDVPNPRARHHFLDPIRNTGLNNSYANLKVISALWAGSKWFYPAYWGFDATGLSAFDRANGLDGDWGNEYENYFNWICARILYRDGLTEPTKFVREKYLGSTFVSLGHICHLLEDQGVPAHTRNDFVWGHLVAGFYKDVTGVQKPFYKGGHPFEAWMEEQIAGNNKNIPSIYLDRLMETPPAFNRLSDYWDKGICEPSGVAQWQGDSPNWPATGFGNPPPEKSWGLAECSNYQFLSFSSMFKNGGLQSFPHPAKEHTRVDWYASGPNGARQYYRIGYDVPHMARVTYTTFYAYLIPIYTVETSTTEEERVYEDYAKRTISRTVDYTAGLLNYFFRGRLNVEQTGCSNGKIEITVTNKSNNSGVSQTLKGGEFTLYWDNLSGNRTPISDFTVYQPGTEVQPGNEWNLETQMNYDESTRAVLTPPESNDVNQYVLVYEGTISTDQNLPDLDDTHQIATGIGSLCSVCCTPLTPCNTGVICDNTPDTIGITLSGVVLDCQECLDIYGNQTSYWISALHISFNVNQTYILCSKEIYDEDEDITYIRWRYVAFVLPPYSWATQYYSCNSDCTSGCTQCGSCPWNCYNFIIELYGGEQCPPFLKGRLQIYLSNGSGIRIIKIYDDYITNQDCPQQKIIDLGNGRCTVVNPHTGGEYASYPAKITIFFPSE